MNLEESRRKIDEIDRTIAKLFEERMETVSHVAAYKKENNMQIFQPAREQDILKRRSEQAKTGYENYARALFTMLMDCSKCAQLQQIDAAIPPLPADENEKIHSLLLTFQKEKLLLPRLLNLFTIHRISLHAVKTEQETDDTVCLRFDFSDDDPKCQLIEFLRGLCSYADTMQWL